MELAATLKSLGRRWYLVVLGLALTLVLATLVSTKVPTTFQATGSMLLMPPEATVGVQGNPYLWLGGLNTASDVLVRRASAVEVTAPLLEPHPDSAISTVPDRTTSSAIVLVTAEAPSAEAALLVRDAGMASLDKVLAIMQDETSVRDELRIHSQALVVDAKATPKTKTRSQLLIITLGGGIGGTLFLASLVDGWLLSRREKTNSGAELSASGKNPEQDPRPAPGPALDPAGHEVRSAGKPAADPHSSHPAQSVPESQSGAEESVGTPLKVR